jgi:hypothetical protein
VTRPRSAPAPGLRGTVTVLIITLAAAAAALLPGSASGAVHARGAGADPGTPLDVRLVQMTPATIPAKGAITMSGTVRNISTEQWSAINVQPFVSQNPITTRADLVAAAATDPTAEVGPRIYKIGDFATVGDLAPGASTTFSIRVPVKDLGISGAPGVYWIGVHALGTDAAGRDDLADGRARTFIPLLTGTRHRSSLALVVPLRAEVRRDADGRLLDAAGWASALGTDGRLRRIADLLNTSSSGQVTLLVDPAVVEAAESLSAGNPGRSLGAASSPTGSTPSSSPTSTGSGTPSPTASPSTSGNGTSRSLDPLGRLDAGDQSDAAAWLSTFTSVARSHTLLGLPYADADVAALARRKPTMLSRADRLSAETFGRLGLAYTPAVAPPDGWVGAGALGQLPATATVLASDHGLPAGRTQWHTTAGQQYVFADALAATGGPGPTPALDALALRQRLLADAALRALSGATSTMVVVLPQDWDPGAGWDAARFFSGLNQSWLDLIPLGAAPAATPILTDIPKYPASERRKEIGRDDVDAARSLIQTGQTLHQLLRTDNTLGHAIAGAALASVSYHARQDQRVAAGQAAAADAAVRSELGQVQVVGTDFVTLSGGSGTVAVTLVNGLRVPIVAGVEPRSKVEKIRIDAPRPIALAPGERAVIRLRVDASAIGVHEVTLIPVTAAGSQLGTPLTFSLRTSQVGAFLWIVIGIALLLFLAMIVRRVLRGLRQHRWRGQ